MKVDRTRARHRTAQAAAAILCALLGGCVSGISSRPDTGKETGFRYSLPQPMLIAKPKTDGTVTFEWSYPPDEAATYVLEEYSFLANNTLDVSLKDGTLSKFSLDADTSAVAAAAVGAAGEVAKERIDAQAQADAAKSAEKKAAAEKVSQAQSALQAAQANLQALTRLRENPEYNSEITPAKLLEAELDVERKRAAYEALVGVARSANVSGGGNTADMTTSAAACGTDQAWGPVLYRVKQWIDSDSMPNVQLVAAADPKLFGQACFATTVLVPPPTPKSAPALEFSVKGSEVVIIRKNHRTPAFLILKATNGKYGELESGSEHLAVLDHDNIPTRLKDAPILTPQGDREKIYVYLPPSIKPGRYKLTFQHRSPATANPIPVNIEFTVKEL